MAKNYNVKTDLPLSLHDQIGFIAETAEPPTSPPKQTASRLRKFFSISLLENRYPPLHGLRLFAILCVVAQHMLSYVPNDQKWLRGRLWLSMDFFFIMSGFLIGNILLSPNGKSGWRKFFWFYLRRSFRILPAYYVTLLLLTLYNARPGGPTVFSRSFVRELFFLTNYPFDIKYVMSWSWSLSLEEHFYLASPFLIAGLLLLRAGLRIPALLLLFLAPLSLRLAEVGWGLAYFSKIFTPTHMRFDPLVMGVMIAYIRKVRPEYFIWLTARPRLVNAVLAASVAMLVGMMTTFVLPAPTISKALAHPSLAAFYTGTLSSVAFGLLLLWTICARNKLGAFLGGHFFRVLATLGYGTYLIHMQVVFSIAPYRPSLSLVSVFVIVIGLSVAYAYVVHIFVEKPLLILRERINAKEADRPANRIEAHSMT